jgi:hypothetical protein
MDTTMAASAAVGAISPLMMIGGMIFSHSFHIINPVDFVVEFFFILLGIIFGLKRIVIPEDDGNIYRKMAKFGTRWENGKPAGTMYGKWFICWDGLNRTTYKPNMIVFTFEKFHQSVCVEKTHQPVCIVNESVINVAIPKTFNIYFLKGSFIEQKFTKNIVNITKNGEFPFQTKIVDTIIGTYEKKKNAVVFISGPVGCGKSAVANQLIRRLSKVKKYKCNFTNKYNMIDPGNTFSSIYSHVGPEENSPLIVLIDEVDGILRLITGNGIPSHNKIPIEVRNKNDWNSFFDAIDWGFFKNTIFILTTNLTLAQIDKFDPAYTREGRVDAKFEIDKSGSMTTFISPPTVSVIDDFSGD